ncbi:carboxymethylenebutenolidase [Halopolyspora algeriensis]|uniref:Carboxymethylenebutenolidase n=1 Tax=Halopolyspora algeriensis TaxID=1500506 RepID=A0A368VV27_9ACTN|nr:dienelactone hydrolase family protein [Halopolyspora algeriensis]RCW45745.1 carboxymethylenebutenolidase [Halopolyspora algeriensis]TQM54129.1 carboxymethylenebutenolidase [Halopolyspora algeriensis]
MCHRHDTPPYDLGMPSQQVHIPLDSGEALPSTCYTPLDGSGPGIVLITDIYGPTPFYQAIADRLAGDGYVVLLVDYFFRQGGLTEDTRDEAFARHSRLSERSALHDLDTALDWLSRQPETTGTRLGTLGFCLGGTLALDLAARRDDLETACYYAFPFGVSNPNPDPVPRPIDLTDHITGNVLAFWGDSDYIGTDQMHQFRDTMRASGASYDHTIYPGVGHGFLRGLLNDGPDSAAALDSWEATTRFFATHVK